MAKDRKKKKMRPVVDMNKKKQSNTFLEASYASVRRILRALGEDESIFDVFTKRQKQDMFMNKILPTHVAAKEGHDVPRQYIRYIQNDLIFHLRSSYFDKDIGVTWMDMATVGQTLMIVCNASSYLATLQEKQLAIMKHLSDLFEKKNTFGELQMNIASYIKTILMMFSQPNFRIYGQTDFDHSEASLQRGYIRSTVYIVTHECQTLRFNYKNRERTAFRIATGQFMGSTPYTGGKIMLSKIFPNVEQDRELDIYIQSHAIRRFKERIDTIYPIMRNEFFIISLVMMQNVVTGHNGTPLMACIMLDNECGNKVIGYFVFTVSGNNMIIITMLPLLSESVPEGRTLYERLHLSKYEIEYLGMDKLSFFYEVDIDQIPLLKQVLFDELHLDYVRSLYNSFRKKGQPFDEKKTLFVKDFFRKIEEQRTYEDVVIE
ncbi:MAG: hypothetical protein LBJ17_09310 [Dysgonamonadaceae bacterium]|jgi:hypothetical protein|nr:hypothetical protein [Dysgonamonadaceae bacterium]